MPAFLLLWLTKAGVPEKARVVVGFAILVLLAILLFFGAKALYDRSIIDAHDQKIEAVQAKEDHKADNKAAEQRVKDETRLVVERQELEEVLTHAPKDPAVDDVVERRLAFHRCLRLQQAARANGKQPPACI